MPIEFNCNECGKLLRVPDGSEGKRAKCPQCETVCTIPGASRPDVESTGGEPATQDVGPASPDQPAIPAPEDDPLGLSGDPFTGVPQGFPHESVGQGSKPNPYASPSQPAAPYGYAGSGVRAHRGTVSLVLGIFSIASSLGGFLSCCCGCFLVFPLLGIGLGIPAWLVGQRDMKRMEAGAVDPSGYNQAKAGMICGIIGVVVGSLSFIVLIGWVAFAIATNAADDAFRVPPGF